MPNAGKNPQKGRKPTLRQMKTASKFLENRGKSVSAAMRASGFSKSYSKNPKQLTKSLGWQALLDKYIPDKLLAQSFKKLLKKKEYIVVGKAGERETYCTGQIDAYAVGKGLELGLRSKNKLKGTEGEAPPINITLEMYGDPNKANTIAKRTPPAV